MEASAAKIFRKGTPSFFLLAPRFFFTSTSEVALREKRGKRGRRKKRERMNFFLKALLNAKVILVCTTRRDARDEHTIPNEHPHKKKGKKQKEKEGE